MKAKIATVSLTGVWAVPVAGLMLGLLACSGGIKGTYSDPNAAVVLELRSGGNAAITFMGETADCTYTTSSQQVLLDCKPPAGKITFTAHDDGSLTGPPGGFMPTLRKQK
jgi:hypothetical protein